MGGREGTGAISHLIATLAGAFLLVVLVAQASARAQDAFGRSVAGVDLRHLLIMGMIAGLVAVAAAATVIFIRATQRARAARNEAVAEADSLRHSHATLQEILSADQILSLYWDGDGEARILCDALPARLDIPREAVTLLSLASWLELDAARELGARIEALRQRGEPFNLMLRTRFGDHIETDGRAAGGTPVFKLRDLAGNRLELARILDQNMTLQAETFRYRALLDAAPFPAWIAGSDGALSWVNGAFVAQAGCRSGQDAIAQRLAPPGFDPLALSAHAVTHGAVMKRRIESSPRNDAGEAIVAPSPAGGAGGMVLPFLRPEIESPGIGDARIGALDRIVTPVAMFDAEQRLIYANPAFAKLWALPSEWLAGRPREPELLDRLRQMRLLPEEADYQVWKARRLEAYGKPGVREEWWHLPDGRSLHVVGETRSDGGVSYLFENLTERLALESQLKALVRVQRETLDNLREGVAVFGQDGRLKLFNSAFASIWRLNARALEQQPHIDETVQSARVLYPDEAAWIVVKHAVTAIGAERHIFQWQMDRPDGSVIASAGLPLPDGGTLITFVDITNEKRVERALLERNEALEAADRLKTSFLSHINYELRTPLTSIIGFTDLLSGQHFGPLNAKQSEYLDDIRASGASLLAIINDVLDLATIDAGAFALKLGPVTASDIVEAAALSVRERLRKSKIALDIAVSPEAGKFQADGKRVTQVLYNLLSNAISFSEDGSQVRLQCEMNDSMVSFTVADQGSGIPDDYQAVVFERFEGRSLGERRRGAGLGLTMVKTIVEMHGGEIGLKSKLGEGTEVTVRFPVMRMQDDVPTQDSADAGGLRVQSGAA